MPTLIMDDVSYETIDSLLVNAAKFHVQETIDMMIKNQENGYNLDFNDHMIYLQSLLEVIRVNLTRDEFDDYVIDSDLKENLKFLNIKMTF